MFNIMSKKIVVISDMTRIENDHYNNEAGAELLHLMYNTYGLSNLTIIYSTKIASAREIITSKGVESKNWTI
jgi:hypothetical protein